MHVPHERAVYLFIWLIILFLTVFGYSQTDSTLANSYFANGENLNHKNAYDSAAVEFRTAGKLYETIANSTGNEKFWIKAHKTNNIPSTRVEKETTTCSLFFSPSTELN